jgi:hypothetical protein
MDFYALPTEASGPLQQGDLLQGVPFSYFGLTNARVSLEDGRYETQDLTRTSHSSLFVSARVEFIWGIVLNQTCDLQPNFKTSNYENSVTLAAVRPIQDLFPNADFSTLPKAIKTVRTFDTEAKAPTVFYLPAAENMPTAFPRSGADLLNVQRFAAEDTPALWPLLRLRLTPDALHAFQSRCAYCFGRYAVPDGFYLSAEERAEKQRQEDESRRNLGR